MTNKPSSTTPPFPTVDASLLTALDQLYPAKSPDKGESFEDLRWRGGERSVVEFLHRHYERQTRAAGLTDRIHMDGTLRP